MTQTKILNQQTANEIIANKQQRQQAAKSLLGFALIHTPHYFTLERADFHPELVGLLDDWENQFLGVAGFRGCAKSTYAGLILPLYAALEGKAKFIVMINETSDVAKLTIANIRQELEHNELIKADYGNVIDDSIKNTKFTETNILLANGCRIIGISRGQKIRGLRHFQYRPDLVIVDDPEELKRVKKKEYRDQTYEWLTQDVIPSIEESKARLVVIANVMHNDGLMARLKRNPLFMFREYALIDPITGVVTWRGKYPTKESLARQEMKVGRTGWLREYLLKIVSPDEQEIKEEWVKFYDKIPEGINRTAVGVDLAISKKETADFTTMVSGVAGHVESQPKIYILPNPVNAHLSMHETIMQLKGLMSTLKIYSTPEFFIEQVGYQQAAIEEAQRNMIPVKPIRPGADKRSRLRSAAIFVQNGTVLFPRTGCEDLIAQILGFGVEDHDDLVDAFVYLILGLAERGIRLPEFRVLG